MSDLSKITAVILAGGLGTRLRKVISDYPKVMAEVCGKPFLYHILDQLADTGIDKVIISTGYMADIVEDTIGARYNSFHVDYSREETPLGTAGALKLAGQAMDTEYCLVMNGDSFTEFDLVSLFMSQTAKNANLTILVKAVDDTSYFGTIEMNEENEIVEFKEKDSITGSGIINAGIYLMKTLVLQEISERTPSSLEYDFFPYMIGNGIFGYKTEGKFIDIGTPESFAKAKAFFEQPTVST